MVLFEKIFQRNDRIFIQFYFFILGISLYFCSSTSYYFRNGTFKLSEDYAYRIHFNYNYLFLF